ncbi:MAG: sensor histidine kinase [Promethearchaeota archaeon]
MIFICILSLLALIFIFIAIILLLRINKETLSPILKYCLLITFSIINFVWLSNFLEWCDITDALDPIEDDIEILIPLGFFIFLVIYVREHSQNLIKEKKDEYKDAYKKVEFYKDIFTHDINNILQNIKSATELMRIYKEQKENKDDLIKDIEELMEIIEEQINRGTRLVSNIRKLSELEREPFNIIKIEIFDYLNSSIDNLIKSFPTKSININLNSNLKSVKVYANELLYDVFENLLINSIKHNVNEIIDIEIFVSIVSKDGKDYVKVEFNDNGIGIRDDLKKYIFNRSELVTSSKKGLGIGLSLVKKIIEGYRGEIWVENRIKDDYTKGSKFIILLPKAE